MLLILRKGYAMNFPENAQAGFINLNAKANVKGEIKAADTMHTHFGGNTNYNDNSTTLLQQNFSINILPNLNLSQAIINALSCGNENAKLAGEEIHKLLMNNNVSEEKIQEHLSYPENLATLASANEIIYKTSNPEKRHILSNLIYKKISSDDDIEEANILTLAIKEMDILTNNHIKALAFLYLIKSGYLKNFSIDKLIEFKSNVLVKIADFKKYSPKTIGEFLSSTRTISDAHVGWGISSYLPQILVPDCRNGKVIDKQFLSLSKLWDDLGFTGSYITPVGKCIAQIYLFENFNICIGDNNNSDNKGNSTKDFAEDITKAETTEMIKSATTNMLTREEL